MAREILRGLVLAASAAILLGCSGASDVGDQKSDRPIAWAKALNHPFTGSDGNITLTVRGGSEVFLSGADSYGASLPVISYTWEPNN
ncbi:MAG TPA: hypothetical protein VFI92_10365, partial [Steroidobacteraceae bacterium]|nr:hypothetical protein [Steroidobacteraceae bacterium]